MTCLGCDAYHKIFHITNICSNYYSFPLIIIFVEFEMEGLVKLVQYVTFCPTEAVLQRVLLGYI